VPTTSNSTIAAFADDTAVMAIGETVESLTRKLQSAFNKFAIWTQKWRIKLNESISVLIDFTKRRLNNNQSSSMAHKFHMLIQRNILI
jgi:chemotaxis methyl-accepting protein methylase